MLTTFLTRLLVFTALWWLLTGGEGSAWLFGVPVIALAASWRLRASAVQRAWFRPWRLASFGPFFLWRSFIGGCDVAWRAWHWRLPIAPVVRTVPFHLPPGSPARVFFANCLSLLPGTLSAAWRDDELQVHLLTDKPDSLAAIAQLERQVALLFGHTWELDQESEER